jgi:hypothetical protein
MPESDRLPFKRWLRWGVGPLAAGQSAAFVAHSYYHAAVLVQVALCLVAMIAAAALLGPIYEWAFPAQRTVSVQVWPQLTGREKAIVVMLVGAFFVTLLGFAGFLEVHGHVGAVAFNAMLLVMVIEALGLMAYMLGVLKRRSQR